MNRTLKHFMPIEKGKHNRLTGFKGEGMSHYLLNQAWDREKERLESIQALHDPITIRHLETLGVDNGWHFVCLPNYPKPPHEVELMRYKVLVDLHFLGTFHVRYCQ